MSKSKTSAKTAVPIHTLKASWFILTLILASLRSIVRRLHMKEAVRSVAKSRSCLKAPECDFLIECKCLMFLFEVLPQLRN